MGLVQEVNIILCLDEPTISAGSDWVGGNIQYGDEKFRLTPGFTPDLMKNGRF